MGHLVDAPGGCKELGPVLVFVVFASNVGRLKGILASVVVNLPSPDGCACSTWADDLQLTYEMP
jgi:5'-methylthioadenosine phosphorylase